MPSPGGMSMSSGKSDGVRAVTALGGLAHLNDFAETAVAMATRFPAEADTTTASVGLARQRRRGLHYPLLRKLVDGLGVESLWKGVPEAAALWWSEEDYYDEGSSGRFAGPALHSGGGAMPAASSIGRHYGLSTSSTAPRTSSASAGGGGAQLASLLLIGGFCVDVVHDAAACAAGLAALERTFHRSSAPQAVDTTNEDGVGEAAAQAWLSEGRQLRALLVKTSAVLPAPVFDRFLLRLTHLAATGAAALQLRGPLAPPIPSVSAAPPPLPGGLLLQPSLLAYVLLEGPPRLQQQFVLKPVEALSQQLLNLFLASEEGFARCCRLVVDFLCVTVEALLPYVTQASGGDDDYPSDGATRPSRALTVLKRVCDALLQPLEHSFTAAVARPGMARSLFRGLALPLREAWARWRRRKGGCVLSAVASASTGAATRCPALCGGGGATAGVLFTVQYRLLRLVDVVGKVELEMANGTASTVSRQQRYERLLRQSRGKMTVSLLAAIAEDKQLVLEETTARSDGGGSGHKVHKLHTGGDTPVAARGAVFVYVDNGSVFYKTSRAKAYRAAKSVEEVFQLVSGGGAPLESGN